MAADSECIFCKIASKQIPASIVYETELLLAFLDVNPLAECHLLVIPRPHFERLVDMPPELCGELAASLPRLGRAVLEVSGADGFNVLQNNGSVAGQLVPHVHIHLIPRKTDDGLGYRWNAGRYPSGRDAEVSAAFVRALSVSG